MSEGLNSGDEPRRLAFERAFDEYGSFFLSYFKKKLRNRANAEDLNQAFWVQVYKTFTTQQLGQFGLLHNKASQALASYFRHAGVRSIVTITDEVPDVIGEPLSARLNEAEVERRFWALFPTVQLSKEQKELFWLHANDEETFKAIAGRLAIPVSTVQDRYAKICIILRDAYNQE